MGVSTDFSSLFNVLCGWFVLNCRCNVSIDISISSRIPSRNSHVFVVAIWHWFRCALHSDLMLIDIYLSIEWRQFILLLFATSPGMMTIIQHTNQPNLLHSQATNRNVDRLQSDPMYNIIYQSPIQRYSPSLCTNQSPLTHLIQMNIDRPPYHQHSIPIILQV